MSQLPQVLYIEANNLIQAWASNTIRDLHCAVTEARTIEAARREIESNNPLTLVLLGDLTRPTELVSGIPLDELSLVRSIRERPIYKDTAIILWTNVNWLSEAYAAGITAHMLKPNGARELEEIITPYLDATAGKSTSSSAHRHHQ